MIQEKDMEGIFEVKISIITPCRNSEKTIERTIKSVVGQDMGSNELEYIIVDGKSTDNTVNIIKKYANRYNYMRYISEKDNSMTEALNKGMKMATGDVVASINADDAFLPGTLKKVCREYKEKKCDILMINTFLIREGGYVKSHNTPRIFSPFLCAFVECPFPECGITFRRLCLESVGYFNESIKYTQDLELYLRLFKKGFKFRYADIDGSCFFISDSNYSSTISDKMRQEVDTYFEHKTIYKYVSGTQFSKLIKVILGLRHYYIFKKFTYCDLLNEAKGDINKCKIGLLAFGGEKWIGGVYYVKNIAYQLSLNDEIRSEYDLVLFTQPELMDNFEDLPKEIKIVPIKYGKKNIFSLLLKCLVLKVKVIYPCNRKISIMTGIKAIGWIPDFQFKFYANLFTEKEIKSKNDDVLKLVSQRRGMILSSDDSYNDLKRYYTSFKANIEIMPFVSYIEQTLKSITPEYELSILQKFRLEGKRYVCVMNQFWQHKNHIVVLEAMKEIFQNEEDEGITFVFTGNLSDYRAPEYIEKVKKMFEDKEVKEHSRLLGFIERKEQITLMKRAEYIIQPSLFEGWGTVVEDAKVLDKTILLSDIPIHREQKNDKCILFEPHDPYELAALIKEENMKDHNDNIEEGIADMKNRAKEYSKSFAKLLATIRE